MKTTPIAVTSKGAGISEALAFTEKLGIENGLDKKSVLHLRLLSEELFGMLRGIAGEVSADYWLETKGSKYELHMKSDVKMTDEMREQFLSASSDGKNYAAKGLMGKIRVLFADMLYYAKESFPYAMINAASAYPMGAASVENANVWSMAIYKEELEKHKNESEAASDDWDELEKSIVANIADDVKVKLARGSAEIIIYKAF